MENMTGAAYTRASTWANRHGQDSQTSKVGTNLVRRPAVTDLAASATRAPEQTPTQGLTHARLQVVSRTPHCCRGPAGAGHVRLVPVGLRNADQSGQPTGPADRRAVCRGEVHRSG